MNQRVSFGPFHFEPETLRLWQDSLEVKLTRKAASVLRLLIARAGAPVPKQEIFGSVWGNTIVSDDALVSCIQELRKALGDDPHQPAYIQTRHRYGYQFVFPDGTLTVIHAPVRGNDHFNDKKCSGRFWGISMLIRSVRRESISSKKMRQGAACLAL
jgi:DNA-binding winged helix-turn-helix (wHTH) protein